jgi:hypothetical protein
MGEKKRRRKALMHKTTIQKKMLREANRAIRWAQGLY